MSRMISAAAVLFLVLVEANVVQAQQPFGGVLKKEPASGYLLKGQTVFVDDGTCRKGYIKQITGGSINRGMHRQRSCVPRPRGL